MASTISGHQVTNMNGIETSAKNSQPFAPSHGVHLTIVDMASPILPDVVTRSLTPPVTNAPPCREDGPLLCRIAVKVNDNDRVAEVAQTVSTAVSILVILLVALIAQRILRRVIKRTIAGLQGETARRRLGSIRKRTPSILSTTDEHTSLHRSQRAETIGALLRSAGTVVIFLFAALAILKALSFSVGSFVAGASVLTAVFAFGAQNIVRDFLAGFFIVVEDQYGVGDVIAVAEVTGTVELVSLRITRLRDADGTLWHVPNGEIKKVGNQSQRWSRAVVDFRLNLDSDIPRAIEVIRAEAEAMWHEAEYRDVIVEKPDVWGPEEVNSDGILLRVAAKTKPLEQWQVARALRTRAKTALDKAGIRIVGSTASGQSEAPDLGTTAGGPPGVSAPPVESGPPVEK